MAMVGQSIARIVHCAQSILSLFNLLSCCASAYYFEMMPSMEERIVNEGTFNITCRLTLTESDTDYQRSIVQNITWSLPSVYDENELTRQKIKELHHREFIDADNEIVTSTLIISNATSKETGYYSCGQFTAPMFTHPNKTQYVYVKGNDLLTLATYKTKVLNATVHRLEVDQGTDVIIPCKATQPFVEVLTSHRLLAKKLELIDNLKENNNLFDDIEDYKGSTNSKYAYDYHYGLTVKNARVSDSGMYKCRGVWLDDTSSELFVQLMVTGVDLAVVGGNADGIEEGSNVTLLCSAHPLFELSPTWRYGRELARFEVVNEERPQKDLEVWRAKFSFNNLMAEEAFYQSALQLFNVTRQLTNNSFECDAWISLETYGDVKKTSSAVTIRFKSKEKDGKVVKEIEAGKETTISCTTTANATEFQWFKDKQVNNATAADGRPDNQLTLKGVPDDAGLYQCIYVDAFGRHRHHSISVVLMALASNRTTTISVISAVLACFAIIGSAAAGFLWFYRSVLFRFKTFENVIGYIRLVYYITCDYSRHPSTM